MKLFSTKQITAVALSALLSAGVWATEIAGVKLQDKVTVAGQSIVLNGAGIRTAAVFKVYVVGLYLPTATNNADNAMSQKGTKRVQIQLLRDVSADDLSKAMLDGIRKNASQTDVQRAGIQLVQLGQVFYDAKKFKSGDVIILDWVPGKGMLMQINNKDVVDLGKDEAFYRMLLGIWLGPNPVDRNVKPALLGASKTAAPPAEKIL